MLFFNSPSGGLFPGITVCQSSGSSVATSLIGLPSLRLETSIFQANPKPWGNFLADDCSVNLYLPQALEFVHSRVSLEADGVVLLQALCPVAGSESPRSPGWNRSQPPGCKQHCQSIPSVPRAEMKAQSQAGLGTGRFTLTLCHTVLHVCPRKLLAAPDIDVLVSSSAQHEVQKNVALRTRHRVLRYANTHAHLRRCEIHHKLLLMRFLQKIITFDRKVKSKIKFLKIIILFQTVREYKV